MVRTQIQLDERTHQALRHRAFERDQSMSAVAREVLAEGLGVEQPKKYSIKDFNFIGAGSSSKKGRANIAENHDEEFVRVVEEHIRRRQ